MADRISKGYLIPRLCLAVFAALLVFMIETGPERALAEKDVVYSVVELEELAHVAVPPS